MKRMGRALGRLASSSVAREAAWNLLLKELSYAHRRPRSLGGPMVYQLETTNHCPYTCNMCPRTHAMTRETGHMDLALFRAIVDQLRPAWQVHEVDAEPSIGLWHFGEPMVYRHFAESVEHCHSRGLSVSISTNPSVWTERRIEEILELGVDELFVMVDGMDELTSRAIRGQAASFARSEHNVRTLAARKVARGLARPRIQLSMVKQPLNAHQWQAFGAHWAAIEGIDDVHLGAYSTFAGDVEEINALAGQLARADADQAAFAEEQKARSRYPCYYPWHSVSVTWDGKVVPCCRDHNRQLVLGDLARESLVSIWNGERMQQLRREFTRGAVSNPLCANCTERSAEIGLPGRHYPIARLLRRRA